MGGANPEEVGCHQDPFEEDAEVMGVEPSFRINNGDTISSNMQPSDFSQPQHQEELMDDEDSDEDDDEEDEDDLLSTSPNS